MVNGGLNLRVGVKRDGEVGAEFYGLASSRHPLRRTSFEQKDANHQKERDSQKGETVKRSQDGKA